MVEEEEVTGETEGLGQDDLELTEEDKHALLIDAEVLLRSAAEKIDVLVSASAFDKNLQDKIDEVWNVLVAKIEEED